MTSCLYPKGRPWRLLLLLAFGVWLWPAPACVYAQSGGAVSFFVDSLDGEENSAVAWLSGVWQETLQSRHRAAADVLGPKSASRQEIIRKADKAFQEGKKAYEELNPERAFKKFTEALQGYRKAAARLQSTKRLAQAQLYIGVGYLLNGKRSKGEQSFRRALLYDRRASLVGITTETDKLQILKLAQDAVKKLPLKEIKITANVSAAVFINGRFRGVSPMKIKLRQGNHILSLRRPGYKRWGVALKIKGQETLQGTLQPLAKRTSYQKLGKAAAATGVKEAPKKFPAEVSAFHRLLGTEILVVAQVKREKQRLWIRAAAYDMKDKRQIAAGGAWSAWPKGTEIAQELLRSLLRGTPVRLGGWMPGQLASRGTPPKKGGSAVGVIVGVTVGVLVVGAGVAVAVYFLTQPRCETGGCIDVTLK